MKLQSSITDENILQDRCERIAEQINIAADDKINAIIQSKETILKETIDLQKTGDMSALALKTSLNEARSVASRAMNATEDAKDAKQVQNST